MKYDNFTYLIDEVKKLMKLNHKMMNQICSDITPEQGKLLYLIKHKNMSQKEIAQHFHITEATLSVRMKRLVESGWIERKIDDEDKRYYSIVLSSKGEKVMNELEKNKHRFQEIVCKNISQEE